MISQISEATVALFALPLMFVIVQEGGKIYSRLRRYILARCVGRISNMIMTEEEPSDWEMRFLRWFYPMKVVIDSVHFVADKIYGNRLYRLALIAEVCEIDRYLLNMVGRKQRASRNDLYSKLSYLPYSVSVAEYTEDLIAESERGCFYAMAAVVSARPERAMRYIAHYSGQLSLHEVAVLAMLLRRTGSSIAYTPLLTSQNRNLQLVGIYLCEHFSLIDAEPYLQRLAESADMEVSYSALLAICAVRGDLSTSHVGSALSQLTTYQRNAFILRAVHNCYSLRSCIHHLTREERSNFSKRVNSYKCRIVCN